MGILVTTSPGKISIGITNEVAKDTYSVHFSSGPTHVDDFDINLDASGAGSASVSPLQAGTYDLTLSSAANHPKGKGYEKVVTVGP